MIGLDIESVATYLATSNIIIAFISGHLLMAVPIHMFINGFVCIVVYVCMAVCACLDPYLCIQ